MKYVVTKFKEEKEEEENQFVINFLICLKKVR